LIVGAFKETPCRLGDGDTPKTERSISVDSPATVPSGGRVKTGDWEGEGLRLGLVVGVGEGARDGEGVGWG